MRTEVSAQIFVLFCDIKTGLGTAKSPSRGNFLSCVISIGIAHPNSVRHCGLRGKRGKTRPSKRIRRGLGGRPAGAPSLQFHAWLHGSTGSEHGPIYPSPPTSMFGRWAPAEGIHGSLQQDMANGADINEEFLSVPDASAHEEKKQLEEPTETQKCMGVSKAGRQCIPFALPGC